MDNRILPNTSDTWIRQLFKVLVFLQYLTMWIFGLTPFSKSYIIYQICILLWCCEIIWSTYSAIIYDIFGDEDGLNGLVSTILYVAHVSGHLVVLAESLMMRSYRKALYDSFFKLVQRLRSQLQDPLNSEDTYKRVSVMIIIFSLLLISCHGIIIWTTFKTKSAATLLYWRALPSTLALQLKSLEFLTCIVTINHYIIVIRKTLNRMGERNLRRVFKMGKRPKTVSFIFVASQNQEGTDEKQLEILKDCYSEIYAIFKLLNENYGWSLLAATAVYFVDFVCNTYWILLAVLTIGRDYYELLQNTSFALLAFILLSILCCLCEESYYQSRYIGCLIAKLVKPLGNKHYNDLVSEFSMQTLHQRFIITAKEFFSLNLNLLGSMVAAIVTYLVILIQFMFTEKSNKESKSTTKAAVITSTTPITTMMETAITSTVKTLIDNITTIMADAAVTTPESSNATIMETSTISPINSLFSNITTIITDATLSTTLKGIVEYVANGSSNGTEIVTNN